MGEGRALCMKRASAPANAVEDTGDKEPCADSCETRTGFCMTCQSNVRVRLPKLPVAKKRPRSSTPATKTTAPIDDGDIGCTKRSKKVPDSSCERVLTERQIANLHYKLATWVCTSAKERDTWARPLAKRFPPHVMAKTSWKELCSYTLGKNRGIPQSLALRWWETHRGKRKPAAKKAA